MRVFISYSWEDDLHKDRVLALAQELRKDGIDAWIDRFTPFPALGWDRWMEQEITAASFVLCVVTGTFFSDLLTYPLKPWEIPVFEDIGAYQNLSAFLK